MALFEQDFSTVSRNQKHYLNLLHVLISFLWDLEFLCSVAAHPTPLVSLVFTSASSSCREARYNTTRPLPTHQPSKKGWHVSAIFKMASANESPPDPIIFKMFGIKPDVHLQVFDQAFHVHSTALKMHSEFFCKFLGSPDKASSTSPSISGFEQNWVTQIDGDGTWSLVSKSVQVCLSSTTLPCLTLIKANLSIESKGDHWAQQQQFFADSSLPHTSSGILQRAHSYYLLRSSDPGHRAGRLLSLSAKPLPCWYVIRYLSIFQVR